MSDQVSESSDDELLAASDSNTLAKLRRYLDNDSCSCCFDLRPLARAQIVCEREVPGYSVRLWTLSESRWTSQAKGPYYGDENELLFKRPLGNIWQDYHIDRPTNTLLDKRKSQEVVLDLKETQHREQCLKCQCLGQIICTTCSGFGRKDCEQCHQRGAIQCCHDESCLKCSGDGFYRCAKCLGNGSIYCQTCHARGRILCPDCRGLRFILVWYQLHVKWENPPPSIIQTCGNSRIFPASKIEKSQGKITCLEFDDVWPSSNRSIENVLDSCIGLPVDLWENIQKKYQTEHCDKAGNIIRLRCVIQRLHIKEIDYRFDHRPDKTYTFCVYGEDETRIYDNQYPYTCCSQSSCTLL